jgi:hypothetical protein
VQLTHQHRTSLQFRALLTTDIAQAGYDIGPSPCSPIQFASPTKLVLQGDYNLSGAPQAVVPTGDLPEIVTYIYDAGSKLITRDDGRNVETVLSGVTTFGFTYSILKGRSYSVSGEQDFTSAPTDLRQVRKIRASWRLPAREGNAANGPYEEDEVIVTIRNYHGS